MEAPAPVATGRSAGSGRCDSTPDYSRNDANSLERQLEQINDSDREFFRRHPKRRWRLRPAMQSEPAGTTIAVLNVCEVRNVCRARMRFPLYGEVPEGLTDRGIDLLMQAITPPEWWRQAADVEAALCGLGGEAGR